MMTHIALFNLGGSSDLTADTDQKRLPSGNRSPQQIAKCASSKVAWVSKELAPNPNASVRRNFELQSTGIPAMEERMLKSSSVATARHNSTSISSQSSSYIASIGEKRFQATKPAHHAAPITMSSLSNGFDPPCVPTRKVPTTSSGGDSTIQQTYLVLEATGEVVAKSSGLQQDTYVVEGCAVRPDWFLYIQNTTSLGVGSSAFRYVKTKHDHEYPQGISKSWRQRVMEKGDLEV
ncbi:hypothetical protein I307_00330 [Cryptococcus deuterogattii 99/473]|uniref:Uncharacterized protein n=1 Tax=Cryptococcus deuterogattii Ram5 TaxID=1296110 RepID=A0A0D0VB20_9TREE|nr:hypothetical protein I313_02162 [Cryptococcus deuterogattii Ram5]KIR98931.1 hypothetical protein L804_03551 [Cryptococcus deuterogattii 2001/935-1]KIY59886.1 hypothetical protein I307_00330 [Cryptococcus deuterogattii 99/473]